MSAAAQSSAAAAVQSSVAVAVAVLAAVEGNVVAAAGLGPVEAACWWFAVLATVISGVGFVPSVAASIVN